MVKLTEIGRKPRYWSKKSKFSNEQVRSSKGASWDSNLGLKFRERSERNFFDLFFKGGGVFYVRPPPLASLSYVHPPLYRCYRKQLTVQSTKIKWRGASK